MLARGTIARRTLLASLALIGFPARAAGAGGVDGLAAIGARAGVRVGTAATAAMLASPDLAALAAGQCASLTPELGMKWAAIAPEAGRRDWREADAIAGFARAHRLGLRGHTLLWHRSVPDWARIEPGASWATVAAHVAETMRRYPADEWDVVNEPIEGDGLRASPFLAAFGPGYVARALDEAHDADPRARLFVNEYDLEYASDAQASRRAAMLRLVRTLRRGGVPIHGVGIQAHLAIGRAAFDPATLRDFLAALADEGLAIAITELDVKERDYVLPATARDAAVADHAARFLAVALAQPAVRALTCWGLSDRQSWLAVDDADRARFPGAWADGSSPGFNRGLPYDSDARAKPLRAAIAGALIERSNMGLTRRQR